MLARCVLATRARRGVTNLFLRVQGASDARIPIPFPRLARDRLHGCDHPHGSLAGSGAGRHSRRQWRAYTISDARGVHDSTGRGCRIHRGGDARRHVHRLQHGGYPDCPTIPGGGRGLLNVVSLIFESLVGGDSRTGQIAPTGLADYWEIAPDNRTYTFHLNKDAKWHDGVDVTAEDVQFSARCPGESGYRQRLYRNLCRHRRVVARHR